MNNMVKVVDMMEKKHILNLRMNDGREIIVETDDLREVLRLTGFSVGAPDLGGLEEPKVPRVEHEAQIYRELAIEQQKQIRKLQEQLSVQKEVAVPTPTQEDVVKSTRQPAGGDVPVAQEVPQPPQAQQQVSPGVRPQMTRQKLPPSSVMDISPEQMQQSIWDGMNQQQQQEWMQKWNPQQ
jgi:hypothetical protein